MKKFGPREPIKEVKLEGTFKGDDTIVIGHDDVYAITWGTDFGDCIFEANISPTQTDLVPQENPNQGNSTDPHWLWCQKLSNFSQQRERTLSACPTKVKKSNVSALAPITSTLTSTDTKSKVIPRSIYFEHLITGVVKFKLWLI